MSFPILTDESTCSTWMVDAFLRAMREAGFKPKVETYDNCSIITGETQTYKVYVEIRARDEAIR